MFINNSHSPTLAEALSINIQVEGKQRATPNFSEDKEGQEAEGKQCRWKICAKPNKITFPLKESYIY